VILISETKDAVYWMFYTSLGQFPGNIFVGLTDI